MFREKPELYLFRYSDSNWAGDHIEKKSILGFVFTFNGEPISYHSKKQAVLALFSLEAKYVALNLVA